MIKRSTQLLASVLLLGQAGIANAALSCNVAVGTLAFGAYSGAQVNSSATMTITCTRVVFDPLTLTYTATLSTGGSGTYAQRRLTHVGPPADTLNYNLYLTTVPGVLNTSVWGDGTSGTVTANGVITFPLFNFSQVRTQVVAGAIAAGPVPSAGSYGDTISVIVTYN
jgi:spore coat protein U-like protein